MKWFCFLQEPTEAGHQTVALMAPMGSDTHELRVSRDTRPEKEFVSSARTPFTQTHPVSSSRRRAGEELPIRSKPGATPDELAGAWNAEAQLPSESGHISNVSVKEQANCDPAGKLMALLMALTGPWE